MFEYSNNEAQWLGVPIERLAPKFADG